MCNLAAGSTTWGCKPEPPKIPSENVMSDVSGYHAYPTLFAVCILPNLSHYSSAGVPRVGKHLFGDNPADSGFTLSTEFSAVWEYNPNVRSWPTHISPSTRRNR
jgi:hypothetical protein